MDKKMEDFKELRKRNKASRLIKHDLVNGLKNNVTFEKDILCTIHIKLGSKWQAHIQTRVC
jgi:hypothetical protein